MRHLHMSHPRIRYSRSTAAFILPITLSLLAALAAAIVTISLLAPFACLAAQPPSVPTGQHIFIQSCASCHDTHSTASKTGPGLKSYYREHQPHPTDAAVRQVIQHGKGKMPAFPILTQSQTGDLIAYLKTL